MIDIVIPILTDPELPRGATFFWRPEILWPQLVSKVLIGICYIVLASFVAAFFKKRKDIKLRPFGALFGIFIFLFGGIVFILDVVNIFYPIHDFETAFLIVTAIITVSTVILLLPVYPYVLKIPSPQQLLSLHKKLKGEINRRQKSEEKEKFLYKFSESVINNSNDFIIAFDKDLRITIYNNQLEKMSGYKLEDVKGKHVLDVFPIVKQTGGDTLLKRVLKGEKITIPESQYTTSEGYYTAQLFPMYNDKDQIVGAVVIVHDITELISAQKKAQLSEARLKEAQNIAKIGHWDWEVNKDILTWSDELYRILEVENSTSINRGFYENFVQPQYQEQLSALIENAVKNHENYEFEHKVTTPLGNEKWILARGKVSVNSEGKVERIQGTVQDITKLKEIENQIRNRNEELEERVRERTAKLELEIQERIKAEKSLKKNNEELIKINNDLDKFVYTASHDLKAPISNMEGLVKILTDNQSDENPEMENVLNMLNSSVVQLKVTIQELVDITKIQKDLEKNAEIIEFKSILEEIKLSIGTTISENGAVIKDDFSACPHVNFSKVNLRSIMYNLIANAIKYRSPKRKPEIEVWCHVEGEFLVLSVKDNGLGIDLPSSKDKLFKMFKRLHDHVEGSGIGLYIINRIVTNAGGKIEVESELDFGTTFHVFFPII